MARKVRPVHCWGIMKRDFIEMEGFGDCRVMTDPRYLSEDLDIIQFWVMTPTYKLINLGLSQGVYINLVEYINDDDNEFEEQIERVMMCELRQGDRFYFGQGKRKLLWRNLDGTFRVEVVKGKEIDLRVSPFKVVRRVKKVRKFKPLSFTEFALSTYEKALERLAEAVTRRQADSYRVEVQKPVKKAENASPIITTKDVPSPSAPVEPEAEDCDRSYCVEFDAAKITSGTINFGRVQKGRRDSMESKAEPDRPLLCSDVIAELEEVRQHEGDLPVSIVNPEDGFRRVNVSGSMLEDLYECGETYWGSRTWDTQPRPGNPAKSELVVSLW